MMNSAETVAVSKTSNKQSTNNYLEDGIGVITILSNGVILESNRFAKTFLGFNSCDDTSPHVSTFFPQLADTALVVNENINPNLRFLSRIGYQFETITATGLHFLSKLFFVDNNYAEDHLIRLIIKPVSE